MACKAWTYFCRPYEVSDKHNQNVHSPQIFYIPLAKQHQLVVPIGDSHITKPFDLIHSNILGPFLVESMYGYPFFMYLIPLSVRRYIS